MLFNHKVKDILETITSFKLIKMNTLSYEEIINENSIKKLLLTPASIQEITSKQTVTCEKVGDGETFITTCWSGFYCLVNIIWRDFGNIHPVNVLTQADFKSVGFTSQEFLDAVGKIRKFTTDEIDNTHNLIIDKTMIYLIFSLSIKVILNQVIYGHYWSIMAKEKKELKEQLMRALAAATTKESSQVLKNNKTNYDCLFNWMDQLVSVCIDKMKLVGMPTEPIEYDTDDVVNPGSGVSFYKREGIKRNLNLAFSLKLIDNLPETYGVGGVLDIQFEIKDKTKCRCCGFREEKCEKSFPNCVFCKKPCENEFGNSALPLDEGKCCNVCNGEFVIPARIKYAKIDVERLVSEAAAQAEAELLAALDAEPKPVKAEKKKEKKVNKFACPCGDKNCMPRPSKTAWVNGVKRDQSFLQRAWDAKHNSSGKHSDSSSDI
jgi:hypothetical protein